jgi:hypothetical protein
MPGREARVWVRSPTFVHAASRALVALLLFWQPIPIDIWTGASPLHEILCGLRHA